MLSNIVGHAHVVTQLNSHLTAPQSSYIFHGPKGVGKGFTASSFFRQLACTGTKKEECRCKSCHQAIKELHSDLKNLTPKGLSYGINQVREILEDSTAYPDSAPYKIYVFNDADKITKEASNALLKALEDGPKRVLFIFILDDATLLIPTIRSRSVIFRFSPLRREEIFTFLTPFDADVEKVRLCTNLSEGSIGTALEFLRGGRMALRDSALEHLLTLQRKPYHQIMEALESEDFPESLFYLLRILFTDMALIHAGLEADISNFDKLPELKRLHTSFGGSGVSLGVASLNKLYEKVPLIKATFPMHLNNALFQIKRGLNA